QHEVVFPGSMYRSVGNKKEIMLMRGQFLYIFFHFHFNAIFLCIDQCCFKLFGIDGILETEINRCSPFAVENIIRFILRKVFSEMFFRVCRSRMTLNGKIASIKSIEKIKTNGKLCSETLCRFTEQIFIIMIKKKVKRGFH